MAPRPRIAFVLPIACALLVTVGLLALPSAQSEARQSSVHTVGTAPAEPIPLHSETASTLLTCGGESAQGPYASETVDALTSSSWQQASDRPTHGKGFVPPPMDLSHLTEERDSGLYAAESLPSSFDWRDKDGVNYVTPVKDQETCGACYAFAALGDLEAKLLINDAEAYDLSENNAKECNWYDASCAGGNYWMVVNLLSKQGTVLESCDPYEAKDDSCTTSCAYQQTVLDWRIISGDGIPSLETLKHYIYTHGPVYVSMYAGDGDAWDSELHSYDGTGTLYYTGTEDPNHAVLIVGWDDDLEHDGGFGGWIVKNSWGTDWGDNGYFRIAYGSASIGKWASFVHDWQPYDEQGALWYYDEGGWMGTAYGYEDTTAWGLASFTPDHDTNAVRVELWTTDATTDIDLYLYDDFDGSDLTGLLGQSMNHAYNEAGYHSMVLENPVVLNHGDDVFAAVKVTNEGYAYPIAVDTEGPSEVERTYLSHSGNSWTDLGATYGDDAGIRLRTAGTVDVPVEAGFSGSPTSGPAPLTVDFTNLSTGDYDTCSWDFGDGDTSTSCSNPSHEYAAAGTYTVTLSVDGSGGTDTEVKPAYVTVESLEEYTLDVTTVGHGTVTKEPDQDTYHYGDVVTLTANADPGWTFASWTGTASSTENPLEVMVEGDTVITATFTQDEYALDVDIIGEGDVDIDPEQDTYLYGDVVTLTATADPGWTFEGWSGDVDSTDNPLKLTIHGDTAITATFTQDEYVLDVSTIGEGDASVAPEQATYVYGDVVTLTATADPGWTFVDWTGDVDSTANPLELTIEADTAITAHFEPREMKVYLPLVLANR